MPAARPQSSRTSVTAAGWGCGAPADISDLYRPEYQPRRFSWFSLRALWQSRNDRLARLVTDVTEPERHRWVRAQLKRDVGEDLTVRTFADREDVSFLVLGDTGEGDNSQYHVVRPLLATSEGTSFTYIISDVIYPAGDVADYEDKFLHPYQRLPGPIFAVPGNHDWYDGLHGFMTLLCGADPDLRPPARRLPSGWKGLVHRWLWRQPNKAKQEELERLRALRPVSNQPGPYFAIELKDLLLVGIDTGIRGVLDAEQAEWLRAVSTVDKDKILLTGKPLVVNARRKTVPVDGSTETVNDLVADPQNRYIAVIGGDTHNYQRYPVTHPDGRTVQYIVSGAGGAYTKATHTIPLVTPENSGCTEDEFRCYPLRGDSLATYSVLLDRRFGLGKGVFVVPHAQAPALMAEHLRGGVQPSRVESRATVVSRRARLAARFVLPQPKGVFHRLFSEFLDWDGPDPPMFKSFLRLDLRPGELRIRCFGVTGCAEHELEPTLEDHILGTRTGAGRWSWREVPPEAATD